MRSPPAPEYQVFPTRERPLKPYEAAVRASAVTRELIRELDADAVVVDILTVGRRLAAQIEQRPWATLVPHVLPIGEPAFPPYSSARVYPRTASRRAGLALDAAAADGRREPGPRRAQRDARAGRPAAARPRARRDLARAGAGGDAPAARVPARRAAARHARDRAAAVGAAVRRRRAAARRRPARAGRPEHLAGSRADAAARRARGSGRRAGARARDHQPPPAARSRCPSRRTRASSTGSPTRARCPAARRSSATPGTARSRAR